MFELLTLIQTGKIKPIPILLFGREFWNRVVNFDALVEEGVISPRDLDLFTLRRDRRRGWDASGFHATCLMLTTIVTSASRDCDLAADVMSG